MKIEVNPGTPEEVAAQIWPKLEEQAHAARGGAVAAVAAVLPAPLLARGDRSAVDRAPEDHGCAPRGHRPPGLRPDGSQEGVQEGRLHAVRRDDGPHPGEHASRSCSGSRSSAEEAKAVPAIAEKQLNDRRARRRQVAERGRRATASGERRHGATARRGPPRDGAVSRSRSSASAPRSGATIRARAAAARSTRSATARTKKRPRPSERPRGA